jgi:hypothetical protein
VRTFCDCNKDATFFFASVLRAVSTGLRPSLIGAKSCDEKRTTQPFVCVPPGLIDESCMKNKVGPTSIFHRKVA